MHDADEEEEEGDIMVLKRELIKEGLRIGQISRQQIQRALPLEHMTESELEMLLFTFESLGIRLVDESDDGPG